MRISNRDALDKLRAQIDQLDEEIIALLAHRVSIVSMVSELKDDEEAVRSTNRVELVIQRVRAQAIKQGLDPNIAEPIYRVLIEILTEFQLRRLDARR